MVSAVRGALGAAHGHSRLGHADSLRGTDDSRLETRPAFSGRFAVTSVAPLLPCALRHFAPSGIWRRPAIGASCRCARYVLVPRARC